MPSERHPALLVYNPKAGRRTSTQQRAALVASLVQGGFEVETVATQGPAHATELARRAVQEGRVETVFALGGDGTLREAAAGLLGSRVALGVLPGGTANVLALALGVPRRPLAASRAYSGSSPLDSDFMDVGMCNETPFLMMISLGLDAQVMASLPPELKRRWGRSGVVIHGLRKWWRHDYGQYELETGGHSLRGSLVAVCNIPYYGGPYRMAPQADPQDGYLDLVVFYGKGRGRTLTFAADLILNRHVRRPDVETLSVQEVEVQGQGTATVQVDGDPMQFTLPLKVTVARDRLRLLAPSGQRLDRLGH